MFICKNYGEENQFVFLDNVHSEKVEITYKTNYYSCGCMYEVHINKNGKILWSNLEDTDCKYKTYD